MNLTVIFKSLCTLGKAWDKPSTQKCFIFTRSSSNHKPQLEPGKKKGASIWSLAAFLCTCPHTWTDRDDSGRFHGHPVLLFPKTMRRLVCKERSCRTTDFFLSLSCDCALLLLRLQQSTVTAEGGHWFSEVYDQLVITVNDFTSWLYCLVWVKLQKCWKILPTIFHLTPLPAVGFQTPLCYKHERQTLDEI